MYRYIHRYKFSMIYRIETLNSRNKSIIDIKLLFWIIDCFFFIIIYLIDYFSNFTMIYIYIYVYKYIYVYICIYLYMYKYIYVYMYSYMYIYCVYMYIHLHIYEHTYIYIIPSFYFVQTSAMISRSPYN
jgi:hypothetical protein